MVPQENLTVRLRNDLFAGRKFTKAMLHAPKAQPQTLEVSADGQSTAVKVPQLTLWAIVELGD